MAVALEYADVPARAARWYRQLYIQVLIAITLGVSIGHFLPETGEALKPLGDAFIRLVKMIIAPVIFITLVTGIAGMRELSAVGRVAGKAFAYFLFFSTLALIVGLLVANIVQPGVGMNAGGGGDLGAVEGYVSKAQESSITGFLIEIIPTSMLSAFTGDSLLQVLLVSILFGIALSMVGEPAAPVRDLLERIGLVIFKLVGILMRAAPIGAFGAMAYTIGKFGLGSLVNLAGLIATFYLTSLIFVLGILGIAARLNGFSILRLIRYLRAELLLVLGTSSSESALPSLMDKMERAGCAKPVVGLVVPTGYSFNLDGTNIYMTLAALFIAQAYNVELTLMDQLALLAVAMISSKGAAGVTGAGFITLAATLSIVPSIPIAGMALILGIDRFMSECRSLTNFIGNAVATVIVARWDNALDKDALHAALHAPPANEVARPATESDPD